MGVCFSLSLSTQIRQIGRKKSIKLCGINSISERVLMMVDFDCLLDWVRRTQDDVSEVHLWVFLYGCFRDRLTERERPTLCVGSTILWAGTGSKSGKGAKLAPQHPSSLFSGQPSQKPAALHSRAQLTLLPWACLPFQEELYPSTVAEIKSFLL